MPCGSDAEVIEPFVPGAGAEAGAGGGLDRSEVVALERTRRCFDGDVDDAALEIGDVTLVHRPRRVKELEGPTLHELERVEQLPSVDEGVERGDVGVDGQHLARPVLGQRVGVGGDCGEVAAGLADEVVDGLLRRRLGRPQCGGEPVGGDASGVGAEVAQRLEHLGPGRAPATADELRGAEEHQPWRRLRVR